MNTMDYLLLAVLAAGFLYMSYRLFLGYLLTRSRDLKAEDDAGYLNPSRAENSKADLKR